MGPFPYKQIGMIVGGTGITPMIQALHATLGDTSEQKIKIKMLYGSRESSDILGIDLLEKHLPSPKENDICIFVCGPPPLYNAICGPRDEKDVKGVLNEMGYNKDQVYKF